MPSDRFAFAVGIACQIDLIRFFCLFFERTNEISFSAHIDVLRRERILHVDAELTLREIAQMPHRSPDDIVLS